MAEKTSLNTTGTVTIEKTVQMHQVDSGAIESWGYDRDTRQMVVRFHHGGTYAYAGVPATVALDVIAASHPGSVFHKKVRDKFPAQKIG